jgi:hypothetical protein
MRLLFAVLLLASSAFAQKPGAEEAYRLLATGRTSTMEKEINQAAADGYRFAGTMGGEMRGGEIISIMKRIPLEAGKNRYTYKLLATTHTGTMQKELQEMADAGYEFAGETARNEIIIIMEKDMAAASRAKYEYKLLATSRTGTMEKELNEAVQQGYEFLAVLRRGEVISILRKKVG